MDEVRKRRPGSMPRKPGPRRPGRTEAAASAPGVPAAVPCPDGRAAWPAARSLPKCAAGAGRLTGVLPGRGTVGLPRTAEAAPFRRAVDAPERFADRWIAAETAAADSACRTGTASCSGGGGLLP